MSLVIIAGEKKTIEILFCIYSCLFGAAAGYWFMFVLLLFVFCEKSFFFKSEHCSAQRLMVALIKGLMSITAQVGCLLVHPSVLEITI